MYTYVKDGDKSLASFSIEHDKEIQDPIHQGNHGRQRQQAEPLCQPWSPPAWMKDNNDMLHGGNWNRNSLKAGPCILPNSSKLISRKVSPFGASASEWTHGASKWESCIYTAAEERDFLKITSARSWKRRPWKIPRSSYGDHNRDMIYQRALTYLSDPEAAKYIWGSDFTGMKTGAAEPHVRHNLRRVYESFPIKTLLYGRMRRKLWFHQVQCLR